ncbi:MAG: aminoacyl-histidine dipeptidase [Bacteroidota bacterium]|nr:aminoacyl-histidine dipeptidase [Bacteroidota bacterium]MDP3144743.1 aminoacyl-histidine dipeptidase [Bacteroidota bacterium]
MSQEIRNLEPNQLWNKFADLNAVPRPSKKEERVIEFVVNFGKSLGLETFLDDVKNVIIRKPATAGMENRKAIVLQSHLDMVHQKNSDTVFDFDKQGIEMYVDGDWVRAKGTTLGADNGIGVATIMAILESKDIAHPAIEALFTIDEETGMTGALGLKGGILKGEILLNLDTEEDTDITIGCAGGVDVTATRKYNQVTTPNNVVGYAITVKGLSGGHSGMDIHKGLGNANKIMNRLLYNGLEKFSLQVAEINGGSLRNAIPRESSAKIVIAEKSTTSFIKEFEALSNIIKTEFKTVEPNLTIELTKIDAPAKVMDSEVQKTIVKAIYAAQNGVYRMSNTMKDLVETSNNIARILIKDGEILIACLTRSSVETSKNDLANSLQSAFELASCQVTQTGSYPGWTPNVSSPILDVLASVYQKQNNSKPNVVACHAGLECGILGTNYPNMDMVSFGPTIRGAHSPDERASISSVQKYWNYVLEILVNIPLKK